MKSTYTTHKMRLNPQPFEMMKNGQKTIELRLLDEKRRRIAEGDRIIFTNTDSDELIETFVVKIHRFDTFEELYENLPLLRCGYTSENVDTASFRDMEEYYSVEEQAKYGVVGIELCRVGEISKKTD